MFIAHQPRAPNHKATTKKERSEKGLNPQFLRVYAVRGVYLYLFASTFLLLIPALWHS
jgi:hypothetical protein